jgi:hypothetical protein
LDIKYLYPTLSYVARPRSDTRKTEQINVRLTPELAAALEHIRALDDIGPQEFIRQTLEDKVQEYEADPRYQEIVRTRLARRAERERQEAQRRRSEFDVVRGASA